MSQFESLSGHKGRPAHGHTKKTQRTQRKSVVFFVVRSVLRDPSNLEIETLGFEDERKHHKRHHDANDFNKAGFS